MIIGIPKGLLYHNYESFLTKFFEELEIETIISHDTNKDILNLGVKYCIDEACLPLKIFHGHVAWLRDKCDLIIVPRIIKSERGKYICPKFCGLPETIKADIPDLPEITAKPLYLNSKRNTFNWCRTVAKQAKVSDFRTRKAFEKALKAHKNNRITLSNKFNEHNLKILIAGHPYNINDNYVNMKLVEKLERYNINVFKNESFNEKNTMKYVKQLSKKPFWTFLIDNYGACLYAAKKNIVDGIIFISSFGCGIDSICIDLIKSELEDFPLLILKVDEQTGEEGLNTRLEAFIDMLDRRTNNESNLSTLR